MLDHTDKRILEELKKNARISMKELGENIHMTGQATANRVLKLEEDGVIEGYTIHQNYMKTGYPVHSFINIYTKSFDHKPFLSFIETQHPYIVNNFKISGEGCYLMECRFPSNEVLDRFLGELNHYVNYKLSLVINN
ncbi:HTH-type transcriptional regulator LrpA [Paenibacillus baekrokdamisoli]|uniref:HTH-type transcriptional regulator LrpA n=1 Tax=Paenibacillus baekrokdamisoli TaxID=1712516 RepID=A0A3G9JPT5_9BACL|nr:Lrp/AsnC family transcriptional regulator [Paenibacillus baekrokdamisoli]MBB3072271.1 Lrp/AsnC family leucine-responsive transcriptional regulator [Paenibacillus baekrokdamisoli]BBH24854.1 HTH-type transcriptional regulator LrpA [Paenibacillus baekrokdamisoli]